MELLQLANAALGVAFGTRDPGKERAPCFQLNDTMLLLLLTVLHLGVWRVTRVCVFMPLASTASLKGKKREKFASTAREMVYYMISFSLILTLCIRHKAVWSLWKAHALSTIPLELKFVYLNELAWYFHGLITLLIEPKKKDFLEFAVHHVITIILIGHSYCIGHYPVGLQVILLHNASDPLLHLAKLLNYTNIEPACTIIFASFMLVFFLSRLVLYPVLINNLMFHFESELKVDKSMAESSLITQLAMLVPIHMRWFYLIVQIAIRTLKKGRPERDERSEDDDDDAVVDTTVDEAESHAANGAHVKPAGAHRLSAGAQTKHKAK